MAVTIDGTNGINDIVLGSSTPAAATVTTFTSNGIDDNANAVAITIDSSENVGTIGDLNQDDEINVIDIVLLVNAILDGASDPFIMWTGDINQDESLNVLDIVMLVNIILEN